MGHETRAVVGLLAVTFAAAVTPATERTIYPSSPRGAPAEPAVQLRFDLVGQRALSGLPSGPALPCGDEVWVVATDAALYAVSSAGELRWRREDLVGALLSRGCEATSDGGEARLWIAMDGPRARLEALSAAGGLTELSIPLPAPPSAAPVVVGPGGLEISHGDAGAEIWLALADATLRGFHPELGSELWVTRLPGIPTDVVPGGAVLGAAVTVGERLVRGGPGVSEGGVLRKLPPGATAPVLRPVPGRPLVDLYLAGGDGYLRAHRCRRKRETVRCRERWGYRTGARMTAPPLLVDGLVLGFSYDNYLYALSPDNGHLRWRQSASHRLGFPAAVLDGRVLVAPLHGGRVTAFRLRDGAPAGEYRGGDYDSVIAAPALRGMDVALLVEAGLGDSALRLLHAAAVEDQAEISPPSP